MKSILRQQLSSILILILILIFCSCGNQEKEPSALIIKNQISQEDNSLPQSNIEAEEISTSETDYIDTISLANIPGYNGNAYIAVNNNVPYFTESEKTVLSSEFYSELDFLGRCGICFANIGIDLMPTEERSSIGQVKPTGWQTIKYDIVDGKYLYNRCHLIGWQLTAENANPCNLITGTRYLNIEGMLPFENMVADYIKETGNHVLYRVTPVFSGNNLLADGVEIEAESVEDSGDGIFFNVFCYNVQPGITIDYATGNSYLTNTNITYENQSNKQEYILNTGGKKFHYPDCSSVTKMKEENKSIYYGNRDDLITRGYSPCGKCNP